MTWSPRSWNRLVFCSSSVHSVLPFRLLCSSCYFSSLSISLFHFSFLWYCSSRYCPVCSYFFYSHLVVPRFCNARVMSCTWYFYRISVAFIWPQAISTPHHCLLHNTQQTDCIVTQYWSNVAPPYAMQDRLARSTLYSYRPTTVALISCIQFNFSIIIEFLTRLAPQKNRARRRTPLAKTVNTWRYRNTGLILVHSLRPTLTLTAWGSTLDVRIWRLKSIPAL